MKVIDALKEGPKTIPQLCKSCEEGNEFKIMRQVADLQYRGLVVLDEFERIYREDGGAMYLAKYALVDTCKPS